MEEMKTQEPYLVEPSDMTDGSDMVDAARVEASPAAPPAAPPMDWKRFGPPMAVLGLIMVGVLLAVQYMPRVAAKLGEKTLERVPTEIGDWRLLQTYEMSASAANELKPDEYIARIYVNGNGEEADFTVLAGSHTGAFHNPQVCFRVQNWEFADNREILLNVPGLKEPIHARMVHLISLQGPKREAVGIYFYATPLGYRSDTSSARILLLAARVAGMHQRAYFVRFLKPTAGNFERDAETLKAFAEQTLAAMRRTNPEVVR
ncbi:MAG: EpsI family protein [Fimbriimonadales bacterium]|nr:EpsI family protein [Fimbriimonadales bacterium]